MLCRLFELVANISDLLKIYADMPINNCMTGAQIIVDLTSLGGRLVSEMYVMENLLP